MSYTPFIAAAYLMGVVVLSWAAIAPVLKKRSLMKQLQIRQARMDRKQ